jgi:hypothetical protein
MPANREPLHEAADKHSYYYRRSLKPQDYLLAAGVGLGVGMFAYYVATRFAQRTLLLDEARMGTLPRKRRIKGREG